MHFEFAAVEATLISLHAAGRLDHYWATAIEHASTSRSAAGAALIATTRRPLRGLLPRRPQLPTLGLVAVVGVVRDLAYTIASRTGALSIVSAIARFYPVTTISLGRVLQRQRATPLQLIGIVIALGVPPSSVRRPDDQRRRLLRMAESESPPRYRPAPSALLRRRMP